MYVNISLLFFFFSLVIVYVALFNTIKINVTTWIHIISISIVLLTTIYSGTCVFIKRLPKTPTALTGISLIAALSLVFRRNVYLPFLGESIYPCDNLVDKTPDSAELTVTVTDVPAGTKVVYWAAEPSTSIVSDPWKAYGKYENSGVATSDASGKAVLSVRKPTGYKLPSGRELKPHVHYRFCQKPGMLSEIRTINA